MIPILRPYLIGITGGSASGKTTVGKAIKDNCDKECLIVNLDNFFKQLTPELANQSKLGNYNVDIPEAIDYQLLIEVLTNLLNNKEVKIPIYDFKEANRTNEFIICQPKPIIILEGLHVLYWKELRDLIDLKIFVLTDDDLRLSRRITRDVNERGQNLKGILEFYEKFVKNSYEKYIKPCMKSADLIIPWNVENKHAIKLITSALKSNAK